MQLHEKATQHSIQQKHLWASLELKMFISCKRVCISAAVSLRETKCYIENANTLTPSFDSPARDTYLVVEKARSNKRTKGISTINKYFIKKQFTAYASRYQNEQSYEGFIQDRSETYLLLAVIEEHQTIRK